MGVVTGVKKGTATITATSKVNKKVKAAIKVTVKDLKPTSVALNKSKVSLDAGAAAVLKAAAKPAGVYCPVKWSTSKASVAAVDKNGKVTAKGNGTATITCKTTEKNSKGKYLTAKCKVTVTTKVTELAFRAEDVTIKRAGAVYTNTLDVKPATASNKKVTYTSSDEKVAAVDASGKVTAVGEGTAVITAAAQDGSKKTASYKVTVIADRVNDDIKWQYMEQDELFDILERNGNIIVLDIRPDSLPQSDGSDAGYAAGHIEGSLWIPAYPVDTEELESRLTSSYVMERLTEYNDDSPIVIVCQSGAGGAKRTISVLKDEGIDVSRLYILTGGGKALVPGAHKDQLVTGNEEFAGNLVISAADLKKKLDANETLTLVDTRGISGTTKTAKGAITTKWQELSNVSVAAGEAGFARPLPASEVSEKLSALGLGLNDEIVLFSDEYITGGWGDDGRVAWQLIACGYTNVKIVDGGLPAMEKAGIPTQEGASKAAAKTVAVANVDTTSHDITAEELKAHYNEFKIVDVRENAEYQGEILYDETSGGHLKGAIHIRFTDLFKYDGTLKSVSELTKMFEGAGLSKEDKIVTYCTAGIRSAYVQLVLQMCGFENSYNYAESVYRWSNTADAGTADYWDAESEVTSVSFREAELKLSVKGATGSVAVDVKPVYATNRDLTYTSVDKSVAAVDQNGRVTATGYGETTILAVTKDGSSQASYKVTVTKPESVGTRQVFVSPEWVQSVISGDQKESSNYFVAEVSYGPTESAKAYKAGHVPGAYHINSDAVEYDDWNLDGWDDQELYGKEQVDPEDNFNIRSVEELSRFLKDNNITKDTTVIFYGKSATSSDVTRVAFACLYMGVENVKVIDGGMNAWTKADLPIETTVNTVIPGGSSYKFGAEVPAHPEYIMDIDTVKNKLEKDPNFRLVSIRSYDEFIGKKTGYAYISRAGEPEGAVWGKDSGAYVNEAGTVIGIDQFEDILKESNSSLDNELSFYCGTGWRATIPFFICYQAGMDNMSLYDGGWWEWQLDLEKNPYQTITPEQAAVFAAMKFENAEVTQDVNGKTLSASGRTAAENKLKVTPARCSVPEVTYSTDNEKVAIVDAEGVVTTTGCGEATITATAKDGRAASYKVKVLDRTTEYGDEWASLGTTYEELKAMSATDRIILDIRPDTFEDASGYGYLNGHIKGSLHCPVFPVQTAAAEDALQELIDDGSLSGTGKIVVICRSGNAGAKRTMSYLKEKGIDKSRLTYLIGGGNQMIDEHKAELEMGNGK